MVNRSYGQFIMSAIPSSSGEGLLTLFCSSMGTLPQEVETRMLVLICSGAAGKHLSGFAITEMSHREEQVITCCYFTKTVKVVFKFCKYLNHN